MLEQHGINVNTTLFHRHCFNLNQRFMNAQTCISKVQIFLYECVDSHVANVQIYF